MPKKQPEMKVTVQYLGKDDSVQREAIRKLIKMVDAKRDAAVQE